MPYKYVPIAKEDTYKLIDAAQNGDRRARDLIVDQNIGLVKNLAMRYASGYYEPDGPDAGRIRGTGQSHRPVRHGL